MWYRDTSTYTKKNVSKAWLNLASWHINDEDLWIINDFRYAHELATRRLHRIVSSDDLVKVSSRRLKRTPAIIHKIKRSIDRWNKTQLARMQDVWWCRCIFDTLDEMYSFYAKTIKNKIEWFRITNHIDYIRQPKKDGYRWIHIIFEYDNWTDYDGLKIELQLRTKLQHSWSTAIEIIDSISDSKMKFWEGDKEYRKFFRWVSVLFEGKEWFKRWSRKKAKKKIVELQQRLDILWELSNRTISYDFLNWMQNKLRNKRWNPQKNKRIIKWDVIIQLTRNWKNINIKPYSWRPPEELKILYLQLEKKYIKNRNIDIVYLSSDEIELAYPNYVWDAKKFIKECRHLIS